MLSRETNKLELVRMRVNKMHRDEKIDEVGSVTSGQTLLDKIRDEDQTANLTVFEKEKRLKS